VTKLIMLEAKKKDTTTMAIIVQEKILRIYM
jgi:hypothetical protein